MLLYALLVQLSAAASVVTSPTNNTAGLTQQYGSLRWLLTDAYSTQIGLAPLTQSLARLHDDYAEFENYRLVGTLVATSPSNSASISSQDISLISCDSFAYPGYIDAADTVSDVVSQSNGGPVAVVLYSTQSDFCNYTASDSTNYSTVFTVLEASAAQAILDHLDDSNSTSTNATSSRLKRSTAAAAPVATIVGNMSSSSIYGGGNYSSSGGTTAGGDTGSSTTAVAMIILYTITGIITALFLGIIITGAVRAHRHPERYGPRNVTGRPRQSRARGIARAMLETIPIVKFGDKPEEGLAAAKHDLEMASRNEEDAAIEPHLTEAEQTGAREHHEPVAEVEEEEARTTQTGSEHAESLQTETEASIGTETTISPTHQNKDADFGNNVCPICTDEFVKGQDVRLLPCSHQFHPDCIDPWLINVSGTCPLCRTDLNPAASQPEAGQEGEHERNENGAEHEHAEGEGGESAGMYDVHTAANHPARSNTHRGLAGYLSDMRDVRRARNAPVEERLEALRRLRQSNMNSNATQSAAAEVDEGQGRRRRHLSTRLRDRFRIRTRQHGSPADDSPPSPPS